MGNKVLFLIKMEQFATSHWQTQWIQREKDVKT
jgi:hypothetical protein